MKKMIPALCLTFALASVCGAAENAAPAASAEPAAPTAPAPAKPKVVIGYVDVRRIVYGSKAGEEAKAILQKKTEKLQSQIKSREKQLETLKSTLEKQAPKMTEAQRRAKAQEFEKKVNDFRDFLKKAEKEMSAQDEELSTRMLERIRKGAKAYGEKAGLAAVLSSREMLFGGDGVELTDVTAEVLKMVDQQG